MKNYNGFLFGLFVSVHAITGCSVPAQTIGPSEYYKSAYKIIQSMNVFPQALIEPTLDYLPCLWREKYMSVGTGNIDEMRPDYDDERNYRVRHIALTNYALLVTVSAQNGDNIAINRYSHNLKPRERLHSGGCVCDFLVASQSLSEGFSRVAALLHYNNLFLFYLWRMHPDAPTKPPIVAPLPVAQGSGDFDDHTIFSSDENATRLAFCWKNSDRYSIGVLNAAEFEKTKKMQYPVWQIFNSEEPVESLSFSDNTLCVLYADGLGEKFDNYYRLYLPLDISFPPFKCTLKVSINDLFFLCPVKENFVTSVEPEIGQSVENALLILWKEVLKDDCCMRPVLLLPSQEDAQAKIELDLDGADFRMLNTERGYGGEIASALQDGGVYLWNQRDRVAGGNEIVGSRVIKPYLNYRGVGYAWSTRALLALSPDGNAIAVYYPDGRVTLSRKTYVYSEEEDSKRAHETQTSASSSAGATSSQHKRKEPPA